MKEIAPRLRQFIRRHRSSVRPEDLEDLLQDILLSLHSVRATYNPALPFIPWLMAIARNRLVDSARKYRRSGMMEVQVEEFPVTFSSEETNIEAGAYRDPEALRHAVRQLPAGQRKHDEFFGDVEIYRGAITVKLPIAGGSPGQSLVLVTDSQGCADVGVCYPPTRQQVRLTVPPAGTGSGPYVGASEPRKGLFN